MLKSVPEILDTVYFGRASNLETKKNLKVIHVLVVVM